MLSTILVAVPARSRVEPDTISGPTTASMHTWAWRESTESLAHTTATVNAPRAFASSTAPTQYGAYPLALMATSTSLSPTRARRTSSAPNSGESSAPSIGTRIARSPPAIRPTTCSGGTPKVGGHSLASSTPSLPLVPAPQ